MLAELSEALSSKCMVDCIYPQFGTSKRICMPNLAKQFCLEFCTITSLSLNEPKMLLHDMQGKKIFNKRPSLL
jgi:hypothetical protein